MANFLITGVAGFIGSHLTRTLLERGHTVRGIDNFETGRRSNLEGIENDAEFELVSADIRDADLISTAFRNIDYVLHQAAIPSVPRSIEDPARTAEANCIGTVNVLNAARHASVDKVVVASSSSVYGPGEELPKQEDMPIDPISPYALSKFWTERLTIQFADFYDIETVALRYFNVFGPRQDPDSQYAAVIPKFISLMESGERPPIYGDGEQSRDFTYIDNVAEANILAAQSDCSGEVLNIACDDRITINTLVASINDLLGTNIAPRYTDPRPGDVKHSRADISKAKELIGYDPVVDFEVGLAKTIEFMQS